MKTRKVHTAKQTGFTMLWNHRYLVILIFIATYISLELFYGIRDDINSFCRNVCIISLLMSRHKGLGPDRQLATIPLFTTTYTRNHYHHYHKIPSQSNHNEHAYPSSLNDSQLNLKFCSESDKCKFLFPYQPPSYKKQKFNQVQFFTYVNLAQTLNLTVVLPSIVGGVSEESSGSFLFHSCGIIRPKNRGSAPTLKNKERVGEIDDDNDDNDDDKEYNMTALKNLFPNVRFIEQREFQQWMNSRVRKPSIVHEFISVGSCKVQNAEVLNKNHQDFYIHDWSEKLDFYLFNKDYYKNSVDRDGINGQERVTFKKISLGLKSFSSKKSVKLVAQFLIDELRNNEAEILLMAHDLKFNKFVKAFSAIEDSQEYMSVEKIGEICNRVDL